MIFAIIIANIKKALVLKKYIDFAMKVLVINLKNTKLIK